MSSASFDVIVVGAGPAGSSAACHLAWYGLHVLVIEKERFPREKACGDALVPRAVRAVERLGVELSTGQSIDGASIHHTISHRGAYRDFRRMLGGPGHVVSRTWLDRRLLDRALSAGVEIVRGTVRSVAPGGDGRRARVAARIAGVTSMLEASFVVVAAGAAAEIAEIEHPHPPEDRLWGVARRGYVRVSAPPARDLQLFFPILYRGEAMPGYGWVFPAGGDRLNVGVGLTRTPASRGIATAAVYEDFLRTQLRSNPAMVNGAPIGEPIGAPIPLSIRTGARSPVLYVGDAAGLANPFTGEGLAMALESGELAAAAIFEGGADVCGRYLHTLRQRARRGTKSAALFHSVSPSFALDRAADVFLGEDRAVARALDRQVWDFGVVRSCGRSVEAIRSDLANQCGRNGEIYRNLVRDITEDERVGVGRFLGFIESWITDSGRVDGTLAGAALVLEAIGLVAYLHDDLPASGLERQTRRSEGCDILSVVVADMLNTIAMTALLRIEAQWAARLSAHCRAFLMARLRTSGGAGKAEDAELELLVAGTMLAVGMKAADAAPPALRAAARRWLERGSRPARKRLQRRDGAVFRPHPAVALGQER